MTYRVDRETGPPAGSGTCLYSQCHRPLPAREGRGPKYRYCPDRTWPGGKTCKQMAAEERAGHRAAGLDAPLDTFRALTDRLAEVADPLAEVLAQLLDTTDDLTAGALARIGEAERAAAAADDRARTAEEAANVAARARQEAEHRADQAQMVAATATRDAREAQAAADRDVRAADDRRTDAEHRRGQAEAKTAALTQMNDELRTTAAQAQERLWRAEENLTAMTERLHAAELAARQDRDRADHEAARRAEVEEQARQIASQIAAARSEAAMADMDRDRMAHEAATHQAAAEQARVEAETARRGEAVALERAAAAERHLDSLREAIRALGDTGRTAQHPDPADPEADGTQS